MIVEAAATVLRYLISWQNASTAFRKPCFISSGSGGHGGGKLCFQRIGSTGHNILEQQICGDLKNTGDLDERIQSGRFHTSFNCANVLHCATDSSGKFRLCNIGILACLLDSHSDGFRFHATTSVRTAIFRLCILNRKSDMG